MNIAFVVDKDLKISKHFGRAPYYLIVTVEEGQIISREKREKLGHRQFSHLPHEHAHANDPHGLSAASQSKHTQMIANIQDCEVVICGGMGTGAYMNMVSAGIQPIITDMDEVDPAVQAYLEGRLANRTEYLH
ncbi:MAG: NifB/NifX family molybdenum-iron cluster-binding protein [Anaerolineales bacterium]|jgi:predicted Fe-Mo cluster-binding NifX family protein